MKKAAMQKRIGIVLVALVSLLASDQTVVGARSIRCKGYEATIQGTPGDDRLVGTHEFDVIVGKGGDDVIRGREVGDVICAGPGRDQVRGGSGDDRVFGGSGQDLLLGGPNPDRLFGGAGDDSLDGGQAQNVLEGGQGDDELNGSYGMDLISYARAPEGVVVDLATGVTTAQGEDVFTDVEGVVGSAFDDELYGDELGNWFHGGPGDDFMDGREGYQHDMVWYANSAGAVEINAGAQTVTGEGADSFRNMEEIAGSQFADRFTGSDERDFFWGIGGDDLMDGAGGDDTMVGGGGDDTLSGGDGNDELDGRDGYDSLDGGTGNDGCEEGEEEANCERE